MHLKMSSGKWRPFYLGFNVLTLLMDLIGWFIHVPQCCCYCPHASETTLKDMGNTACCLIHTRGCFYQTRSAWSMDQGSNKNHSPAYNAYNFAPTVTKFCVMWEGLSLPHGTKFGNCRCKIVDSRAFPSWSLIHGLRWSGLIKAEPGAAFASRYQPTSGHG